MRYTEKYNLKIIEPGDLININDISDNFETLDGIIKNLSVATFQVGSAAPTDTKIFWIDTNSTTGGLKYYNGSSWVHVPVAYT